MSEPGAELSRLTEADQGRLVDLVASVLADDPPVEGLLRVLADLEREQNPALAVAVFESVVWRADVLHYWVWFRVSRAYVALGPARRDAAFITCALAAQMHPDWLPSTQPFRDLFLIFDARGRAHDAIDVFVRETELHPAQPAAGWYEIAPLLEQTGRALPGRDVGPPSPGSRHDRRVMEPERPAPLRCPVYGGDMPYSLRPLAAPLPRTPIDVAELPDAEVLICQEGLAVFDRDGRLHEDLSVSEYPDLVRRWVEKEERDGRAIEQYEADEAVVILDRFPHPNLCHFLLDQISRLALYQKVGVDTGAALVIGPELRTEFQHRILALAGGRSALGSDRVARVRVSRLWVSSNCRGLDHAGHRGAAWVTEFARSILGGRGQRGWRRLYLSRADVGARHVANEAELVALLERHDFEILVPGRMPYDAQLAAFRQASHVIAPHGAALTHMVLCPEGAHILEMFHPLYGTAAYALQADSCGVRYAALVGRDALSDAPEWNRPELNDVTRSLHGQRNFRVDLDAVRAYLADTDG
jgi:capsular polysaccharide biosynthesis protein